MADYIPKKEGELITWSANFQKKFPLYAKLLGFSDEEVAKVMAGCDDIPERINTSIQAQADAKRLAKEKSTFVAADIKLMRTVAQRSKEAAGYTEEMGEDMKIIGTDNPFDPDTYKTTLSATVFPGRVTVKFVKKEVDGINVYSRLSNETKWEKLAYDTFSPYEDNRPLQVSGTPEMRQYMGIGVIHDHEVGQMSDIIEVVFGG